MFTPRGWMWLLGAGCAKTQNLLRNRGASLSRQIHSDLTRPAEEAASASVADASNQTKKEVTSEMNGFRKTVAAATIAGSMLVGGVIGAALYGVSAISAAAATNVATPSATTPSATTPFVSNETAAHEATESAAREAQENAGIAPTVP